MAVIDVIVAAFLAVHVGVFDVSSGDSRNSRKGEHALPQVLKRRARYFMR